MNVNNGLIGRTLSAIALLKPWYGLSIDALLEKGPRSYLSYLTAMYCNTVASVPLMEDAIRYFYRDGSDTRILAYLSRQIIEERQHDIWLLEDMEVVRRASSVQTSPTFEIPPIAEIAQAVGAQHYHLRHGDPRLLFAYILAEETARMTKPFVSDLIEKSGLPAAAFRTISHHAQVDEEHVSELAQVVADWRVREATEVAFIENACETCRLISMGIRRSLRRMSEEPMKLGSPVQGSGRSSDSATNMPQVRAQGTS